MRKWVIFSILGGLPVVLMGYSTGPPPNRTGAGIDGATNCTACHRSFAPANSDPAGSMRINAANYTPGVKQTISVTVSHPLGARWGFQVTARLASDESKLAGNFTANSVVRVICDDGTYAGNSASLNNNAAPCAAGIHEFAEHLNAPRTDPGAGFTFTVDWTPPATNLGDVVFYAAGNAADGSASNAGDRVYTTVRRISGPCTLTQKPTITSLANGASFQTAWNTGALITLFGGNFGLAGTTRPVTAGDIVSQKFPQALGCVAVTVNGQNAPLIYVQPNQINLQAPTLSGIGAAAVVVIANPGAPNELRSDPLNVTSQQALAPAIFTFNGKSIAATSANGSSYVADPAVVPNASPAKPSDVVVFYATGLGATNPSVAPGDIASGPAAATGQIAVSIGGVSVPAADILYAGLAPQSISGLYQLNLKLPAALPDGDAPVIINVGGVQSPAGATIPIKR
jgi:uncharacterized protein (TIGR03437 family)